MLQICLFIFNQQAWQWPMWIVIFLFVSALTNTLANVGPIVHTWMSHQNLPLVVFDVVMVVLVETEFIDNVYYKKDILCSGWNLF